MTRSAGRGRTASPSRPLGSTRTARARRFLAALMALALVLGTAAWIGWDNARLVTTIHEPRIEALAGLRIAQVSDLHDVDVDEQLLAAVEDEQVDLIALTGDLVSADTADLRHALHLVGALDQIAPTYWVMGNHEADSPRRAEVIDGLEAAGVEVLQQRTAMLEVDGRLIAIVGIDDPRRWRREGTRAPQPDQLVARAAVPQGAPTVLLAHRPEDFPAYARADMDLVLSGHAHGGQVRVPFLGGLWAPHQGFLPELVDGVHQRDGTTLVISRGIGNSAAPIRVNNPPELVIIAPR